MRPGFAAARLLLLLWLASPTPAQTVKIAEGEHYARQDFGAGKVTDTMEMRESWTLSRLDGGEYELEGNGRVTWKHPSIPAEETRYHLRLSKELHVREVLELTRQGSTMRCRLETEEITCTKNGRDARLAVRQPYDLLTGNIWFLAGIARRCASAPGSEQEAQLVIADEPFGLGKLPARVRYLGSRERALAGITFTAREFEISSAAFPKFTVLLSPEGIPLTAEAEGDAPRTELTRYQRHSGF